MKISNKSIVDCVDPKYFMWQDGDYDILKCPYCNCYEIHQVSCEVMFRNEDKDGVLVNMSTNKLNTALIKNGEVEHTRRDYIEIRFYCEMCSNKIKLLIKQQMGNTLICWIKEEE